MFVKYQDASNKKKKKSLKFAIAYYVNEFLRITYMFEVEVFSVTLVQHKYIAAYLDSLLILKKFKRKIYYTYVTQLT